MSLRSVCRSVLTLLFPLAPLAAAQAAPAPGALPTGGQVVSGQASLSQVGNTLNVNQSSQQVGLNWQTFNIGSDSTVNFVQPSASSLAVNRILGNSGSEIFGHLNANGQVWLINPNGVLFGQGSQVNVGGLVAATLDTTDNIRFNGASQASVINNGQINGGYVAFLGHTVENQGDIHTPGGTTALGAGNDITLNFADRSLLGLTVNQNQLNALATNGGLIEANGGAVLLSAGARDSILKSQVNNTGIIEAETVGEKDGHIALLGGMTAGTTNVAGTLNASAPNGGHGGFIETSAAHVHIADGATITTLAANGNSGLWLIDPQDFTIAAGNTGTITSGVPSGDVSGATLGTALNLGNVSILSSEGSTAGNGDINVNDAVSWTANTSLTLTAARNININSNITGTGASSSLVMNATTANGADAAVAGGAIFENTGVAITVGSLVAYSNLAINGSVNGNVLGTVVNFGTNGTVSGNMSAGKVNFGTNGTVTGNVTAVVLDYSNYGSGVSFDLSDGIGNTTGIGGQWLNTNIVKGSGNTDTVKGTNQTYTLTGVGAGDNGTVSWSGFEKIVDSGTGTLAGTGQTYVLSGSNAGTVATWLPGGFSGIGAITDATGTVNFGTSGTLTGNVTAATLDYTGYGSAVAFDLSDGSGTTTGIGGQWLNTSIVKGSSNTDTVKGTNQTYTLTGVGAGGNGAVNWTSFEQIADSGTGTLNGAGQTYTLSGSNAGTVTTWLSGGFSGIGSITDLNGTVDLGTNGVLTGNVTASVVNFGTNGSVGGNVTAGTLDYSNYATAVSLDLSDGTNTTTGIGGTWSGTPAVIGSGNTDTVKGTNQAYTLTGTGAGGNGTVSWSGFEQIADSGTGTLAGTGQTYVLSGSNAGTVTTWLPGGFSGIGTITDATGTVDFGTSSVLTGNVTAATLNYTGYGSAVNVNLSGTGSTGIGGIASGVSAIIADSNLNVSGTSLGSLTITTTGAGTATTLGALSVSGLVLNASGAITDTNSLNVGQFTLNSGNWSQIGATLPAFNATSFTVNPTTATFVRALGGDGSSGNPYQLTDVYGLQGVNTLLGDHFTLANNIDASGTSGWNSGAGFTPIGNGTSNFTGTFDGLNHVISGLTINNPSANYAGLFGYAGTGSIIRNVGLTGGSVIANGNAGGLAGYSQAAISNVYSTNTVTAIGGGGATMGGLVGDNEATIINAYSTGSVTAVSGSYVGGLVGKNVGTITDAYSTGNVGNAGSYVGGFVGLNNGTVNGSYWNITASGQNAGIGGGVVAGATGETTANMMNLATFSGWDITNAGGGGHVWRIYDGYTMPLLAAFLTPVTATLGNSSVTYNGNDQSNAAGIVWSPSAPVGHLFGSFVAGGAVNAGSYTSSGAGVYSDQQGYDINVAGSGTLTIGQASLTLGAITGTKVYDGTTMSTGAVIVSGLQGSDTITGLSQSYGSKNVLGAGGSLLSVDGGYTVHDGNSGNNYTVTTSTAAGTITQATITVTPTTGQTKVYGANDPASGFTYSEVGLYGGDSITGNLGRAAGESVGNYVYSLGNLSAGGNYTLVQGASNTFGITQAPITVTPTVNQSKVYGANDLAGGFTYGQTGLITNITPTYWDNTGALVADGSAINDSLSGNLGRAAGENAGTYAYNLGSLSANSNYTLAMTATPTTFAIIPATITITPGAGATKVYGTNDPNSPFTYTSSGYISGVTPTYWDSTGTLVTSGLTINDASSLLTGNVGRAAGENVGNYAYNAGNLNAGSNYAMAITTTSPATFAITKATLMITPGTGQSKVYGTNDSSTPFTKTVTGLVTTGTTQLTYWGSSGTQANDGVINDSLSGNLGRAAGENVGTYAYNMGGLTVNAPNNYTVAITASPATFAITPAMLTITPTPGQWKVYGMEDPFFTYTQRGLVTGVTPTYWGNAGTLVSDNPINDSLSGSLVRVPGELAGFYDFSLGGLVVSAPGNYNAPLMLMPDGFAITPAAWLTAVQQAGLLTGQQAGGTTLTCTAEHRCSPSPVPHNLVIENGGLNTPI